MGQWNVQHFRCPSSLKLNKGLTFKDIEHALRLLQNSILSIFIEKC